MKKLGTVVSWNHFKGFGCVRVDGEDRTYIIRQENSASVYDGVETPEFTLHEFAQAPRIGDVIRFDLGASYYGLSRVVVWVAEKYWQDSIRRIARRPIYKVVVRTEVNGTLNPNYVDMPGAIGTAEVLQKRSVRGSENDEFAPEFRSGAYVDKRYFMRKENDGSWTLCTDPRPELKLDLHFPNGLYGSNRVDDPIASYYAKVDEAVV
jgi:hypothetical protein